MTLLIYADSYVICSHSLSTIALGKSNAMDFLLQSNEKFAFDDRFDFEDGLLRVSRRLDHDNS